MDLLQSLNNNVEKILDDYEYLKLENSRLKDELSELKSENEQLSKSNRDMFFKIDTTLKLIKAQRNESK